MKLIFSSTFTIRIYRVFNYQNIWFVNGTILC